MAEIQLAALPRTDFGKGAARQLRREERIPAVLYGRGEAPIHVSLPYHDTMLALRQANVLFGINLPESKKQLAVAKDVQRDPVRQLIEHVDLLKVRAGEKIQVEVPIHIVGESADGTIHLVDINTLAVLAEATHIPAGFEIDIEGLEAGTTIHAGEVTLPAGTELVTDPEHAVVLITVPKEEAEEPAEGEEGAEGEAAEGEAAEGDAAEGDAEAKSDEAAE
jgi:large subunit ribosomal protein L25